MTICSKMYEALDKKLDEMKNIPGMENAIDEIAPELCDAVIDPRGKVIRLIKTHKGEQYLKENAKWLGYCEGHAAGADATNKLLREKIDANKDLYDDARSVGLRVGTHRNDYTSGSSMQSVQDEFDENEVVYEGEDGSISKWTKNQEKSCSLNAIPQNGDISEMKGMCPCGCGYRYDEENKEWYNENDELINMVLVNVNRNTYERLLRRRKEPEENMSTILNRIMDGETHEQPR